MRQLPLAASLAFSVLVSSAVASADPSTKPDPQNQASEATDLAIPSMPSIPILPDATASQLYRVCSAINKLAGHADKPFSPEKVIEAVAEARKIEAAPVTPPAPDPRKPTVQATFVDALGYLSGACAAIEAGQLELSEESWTALRTWRSQSSQWNKNVVDAISIATGAERTNIPEAFEGASGLVGSGDIQSMVLNGLADFLVTRAKAEAANYLQAQLKRNLCNETAKPYVPAICGAMMQLDGSISLNATGTYLQAAARRDLEMLPLRVLREKAATSEPQSAALLALMLYSEARHGRQPLELLTNIDGITCEKNGATIFSKSVANASCRASQLIRTMQGLRMDVSQVSDPFRWVAVPLRFEVAFQETSKKELTIAVANRLVKGAVTMNALLKQIEKLATDIAKGGSSSTFIPGITPPTKTSGAKDKAHIVAQSISLLIQMTNLLGCVDEASTECAKAKSLKDSQFAVELGTALYSGEVGEMVVAATDLLEHYKVPVPPAILRVLPLLTEIANAKSSKDVSATLEAAAAPVGSYSAKYERNVIGVNAFVGGSAGLEWVSYNNSWQMSGEMGLFAPIGLEASTPLGQYFHIGAFFSVLDLGSLVSTRLADETTASGATKTEIKDRGDLSFAQVFSPGLFVTVGVAKSPITIGAGLSLTPSLRNQLTTNTATRQVTSSEDLTAFRAQVFAGFDLTLLPF